jgi:dihydrofolate synthase/folylpolyglutamate synthase
VIRQVAERCHAPLVQASAADAAPYEVGLAGAHQRSNAGVAVRILDELSRRGIAVEAAAIAEGLRRPGWPGRLDWRRLPDGREVLLDAAHNPAGASALASYLEQEMPARPPLVFAVMRDKNVDEMLRILAPVIGCVVTTQASTARAQDAASLAERVRRVAPDLPVVAASSVADALAAAWRASPRIVVAGSIFLLGDVLREIRA